MIEKQFFNGYWNLPNVSDSTSGLLTFDPFNKTQLELLGHLPKGNPFDALLVEELIHGFTVNGKQVTLIKSRNSGNSMSFPGIPTTSYTPSYILVGTHLFNPGAFFYNEIEVEIELLTKWVDIWGFSNPGDYDVDSLVIEYRLHDNINFEIDDDVKGCFTFAGSSQRVKEEEFKSKHKAKLKISSGAALTLDQILEYAWHFKKFLTLATQSNTYFKSIYLKSEYVTDTRHDEVFCRRMELLYHQRSYDLQVDRNSSQYFLFSYLDVAEKFQTMITNWYSKKEFMQPIVDTIYESYSKAP
jgi:hypothetical protein